MKGNRDNVQFAQRQREAVLFVLSIEKIWNILYNEIDSWSLIGNLAQTKDAIKWHFYTIEKNNFEGDFV